MVVDRSKGFGGEILTFDATMMEFLSLYQGIAKEFIIKLKVKYFRNSIDIFFSFLFQETRWLIIDILKDNNKSGISNHRIVNIQLLKFQTISGKELYLTLYLYSSYAK